MVALKNYFKNTKVIILVFILLPLFLYSQTPQINAILVNSCSLSEGIDELIVFTNGSSNLDINNISISFPSITPYCNTNCGTKTLINNPTYVNSLNTLAGCSLFQYSTIIPPNAKVIVFTGLNPSIVYDYTTECGNGPYYVIFCNNTSTTGRFANNAGENRTLSINFGSSTDEVTYFSSNANTGDDGDYVTFTDDGTPTYENIGTCAIPLPIILIEFYVINKGGINVIHWTTIYELNNDYFMLENTIDGFEWNVIDIINGSGNSPIEKTYTYNHTNYKKTNNYYRLVQVDFDGSKEVSWVISIDNLERQKIIVKTVNSIGQTVDSYYKGLIIELYDDGSTNKFIRY